MSKLGGYYYSHKRNRGLSSYAKKIRKSKKKADQQKRKIMLARGVSGRGKATLIVLFLIILFLGGLLLFSGFFKVKRAVIVGNNKIKSEDLQNILKESINAKRFYVFAGENIVMVNKGKVKGRILDQIPLVKNVEISRVFPDTLKLKILEMEPFAVWVTDNKKYLVDAKGIIAYEIKDDQSINLPIIYDRQNKLVAIKGEATFPSQMNFIRNCLALLKENNLEIESVSLPNALGFEIDVKIKDSFNIYFNTERSVESQIRDLKSVLDKQLSENRNISYIDLRVENWVYYK